MHIGIDVGLTGALAALSDLPNLPPISILRMPLIKVEGKPQMNTRAIVDWVLSIYPPEGCHVWIEKCPKHAQSQASMRSMAISYGRLLGIFEARFPHMHVHRVRCGRELRGWQRNLLGDFTGAESKAKALEVARQIWPDYEWPADKKGRPYDGITDACLIAEFGRRNTERS